VGSDYVLRNFEVLKTVLWSTDSSYWALLAHLWGQDREPFL